MTTIQKGALLGKGVFSKVYEDPKDQKKVIIFSCDKVKEFMAQFYHGKSNLFLKYEVLEGASEQTDWMKVFAAKKVDIGSKIAGGMKQALKPTEYALYSALRRCRQKTLYGEAKKVVSSLEGFSKQKKELIDFIDQFESLYGEKLTMEISPRNVAVKNSNLILLDIFYIKEDLIKLNR